MSSSRRTKSFRVGIVVHPDRLHAKELAETAREWWGSRGHFVKWIQVPDEMANVGPLDFAVSFGGDGTMLRAVQLAVSGGTIVLGVNLGQLGYLTQVEPAHLEDSFERLVAGEFEIEERMTLDVTIETPDGVRTIVALNEAVLEKTSPGHTIRVQSLIDDQAFLTFSADGMLVATPTGSTAYNLSIRGPIVSPKLGALLLTPISPHMLFDRTLIVDPSERIELQLIGDRPAVLVIDGSTTVPLHPGDSVSVRAGSLRARFARLGAKDFYEVLRTKFNLTDR